MKKLLIINGPNINMLGIREPNIYGRKSYRELISYIGEVCDGKGIEYECYQSNHEGALIDKIQEAYGNFGGIVINPAAYTHTSVALYDAMMAVGLPAAEVHLTAPDKREEFRHISYTAKACLRVFSGHGFESYRDAILFIADFL